MISNKENLIPLVKFKHITYVTISKNFRSEFIIIVRAFPLDFSKNFQNLSRFYLVTFYLDLSLTIFSSFFSVASTQIVIPLVLIFVDKGSRSLFHGCLNLSQNDPWQKNLSDCRVSLIFVRFTSINIRVYVLNHV